MLIFFNSQKGQSSAYIIIFIIVVVFAVMLAGGGSSLFSGNEPSSVIDTPTPVGASDTLKTLTPSPSPTTSSGDWNIVVTFDGCQQGKSPYMTGSVKVEGPSAGIVRLEIDDNGFTKVTEENFTPPNDTLYIKLINDYGFNTKNWRILVISGGKTQATYLGKPTGC